jgi:hypothetical protein
MRADVVEIPRTNLGKQRTLRLDKGFRDVVADYLRRRWPSHTAKNAARAFDWTLDRAREAVAGRISLTSLEQMFKRGGLQVALPIVADVIGQSLAQHLREMRTQHETNGRRLAALLWSDPPGGDFPPGGHDWGPGLAPDAELLARRRVG